MKSGIHGHKIKVWISSKFKTRTRADFWPAEQKFVRAKCESRINGNETEVHQIVSKTERGFEQTGRRPRKK